MPLAHLNDSLYIRPKSALARADRGRVGFPLRKAARSLATNILLAALTTKRGRRIRGLRAPGGRRALLQMEDEIGSRSQERRRQPESGPGRSIHREALYIAGTLACSHALDLQALPIAQGQCDLGEERTAQDELCPAGIEGEEADGRPHVPGTH